MSAAGFPALVVLLLCSLCAVTSSSPPPDLIDICPPFDSSMCVHVKPGRPGCYNDSMCTSPKKCCCSFCTLQCMDPQKVKPGRCPNIKVKCVPEHFANNCTGDSECPGRQKCCSLCGRTCWEPEPDPVGVCPMNEVPSSEVYCGSVQCNRDVDCKPDEKCCPSGYSRTCAKPITDLIDVCPEFNSSICFYARPRPPECDSDRNCTSPNKCCCVNCGLKCVPPQKVKPGRCPNIKVKCDPALVTKCTRDMECPGGQKCCNLCGQTCWEPEPEPKGACPKNAGDESSAARCLSVKCSRDSDCKAGEKCCVSGGEQKCVQLVTEKPGHCPDETVLCKRNTYTCREDSCCSGVQKCCSVCGRNCRDPLPGPN